MHETQENTVVEKTEQHEQSDEHLQEKYENQNKIFKEAADQILKKDIPDEIKDQIIALINEHNIEEKVIQNLIQLYQEYGDDIDLSSAIGIHMIDKTNRHTKESLTYHGNTSKEIINLIKTDNLTILGETTSMKEFVENGNTSREYVNPIYAIPTYLDKDNFEVKEISCVETVRDDIDRDILYRVLSQAQGKGKVKVSDETEMYANTINGNTTQIYKSETNQESNVIVSNLKIEPALDENGNQLKGQLGGLKYRITFNFYSPKEKNGQ